MCIRDSGHGHVTAHLAQRVEDDLALGGQAVAVGANGRGDVAGLV